MIFDRHLVNLSWNADNSPDVVGYNIYRSITSGGPFSKLNAQLNPSTTYTDGSVVSGQTYYYVTTALNSAGMESAYSNETQAVIP
jgi:fibronectin type 3 domain-containing protein